MIFRTHKKWREKVSILNKKTPISNFKFQIIRNWSFFLLEYKPNGLKPIVIGHLYNTPYLPIYKADRYYMQFNTQLFRLYIFCIVSSKKVLLWSFNLSGKKWWFWGFCMLIYFCCVTCLFLISCIMMNYVCVSVCTIIILGLLLIGKQRWWWRAWDQ